VRALSARGGFRQRRTGSLACPPWVGAEKNLKRDKINTQKGGKKSSKKVVRKDLSQKVAKKD